MKLQILILAVGVAVLASCGPSYRVTNKSQVATDTSRVPTAIQTSFTTQYPNVTDVVWSPYDVNNLPIDWDLTGWPALEQGSYVATFNMNGDQYYAWYDANGNWIGSTYVVKDYKSLPGPVTAMINEKFSGYTIASVNSEMRKDKTAYEIQLKNGDNKAKIVVDANGNIIKQKTVTK